MIRIMLVGAGLALMFNISLPENARAQETRASSKVKLVLVTELPAQYNKNPAQALVMRGPITGDLIVVEERKANPALVDAATRTLLNSRVVNGLNPMEHNGKSFKVLTFAVTKPSSATQKWAARYFGRIQRLINSANAAAVTNVPGVGTGRVVQFYLPKSPKGSQ